MHQSALVSNSALAGSTPPSADHSAPGAVVVVAVVAVGHTGTAAGLGPGDKRRTVVALAAAAGLQQPAAAGGAVVQRQRRERLQGRPRSQ